MGHYDTDIHCDKCRAYMFSFLYDHEDSGERVCKACKARNHKAKPLQPEDSRCPPTYRREEAVKTLIALGWNWDGKRWSPNSLMRKAMAKLAGAIGDEA